ncbi:MAG: PEP-CTERM sorting domain-containing protein [Bryobacteraceae bacterium]|jgi:hypothetical protein
MCRIFQLAALGTLLAATASADVIVLSFDGLQDDEAVLDYYNGGYGSKGSGPGPGDGITFTSNGTAYISINNGGTGQFAGTPVGDTAFTFLTGDTATMNVPAGFTTGFSFYYSEVFNSETIYIWSGLNATGTLLATVPLPITPSEQGSNPACSNADDTFCPFFALGVTFVGTAESVDFSGAEGQVAFDDITLGSDTPGVPEPAAFISLGFGLASLLVFSGRQRKLQQGWWTPGSMSRRLRPRPCVSL